MASNYDYGLVLLSVSVAIIAAHSGILIFSPARGHQIGSYKKRLGLGAAVIGSGIWTMHFIGMLAMRMAFEFNYAILPTLVSALVAIVMTGLGLYAATSGQLQRWGLAAGALGMGLGIAAMHYIGMSTVASVYRLSYQPLGTAIAVLCGIGASALALRRMTGPATGWGQNLQAAVALGLAISAMHYIAMAATQMEPLNRAMPIAAPSLNATYLACVIAVAVFFFVNAFLLLTLPDMQRESRPAEASLEPATSMSTAANDVPSVPVSGNGEIRFVSADRILFVTADGHYTRVGYIDESGTFREQICDHSLARLADVLIPHLMLRCHRSHLINLSHVEAIRRRGERGEAVLSIPAAPTIPISRAAMPAFSTAIGKFRHAI